MSIRLGVLAIQGDVAENVSMLQDAARMLDIQDVTVSAVKAPGEIAGLDGLVIPGGESTTIGKLCMTNGSSEQIMQEVKSGMPVLGICAGMVLLASRASDKVVGETGQPLLGFLDIDLERNSFGRQRRSFEADVSMEPIGISRFHGVFIRAPAITSTAPDIEPIAELNGKTVAIRKGNIIGTSFHPELTGDPAVHKYFVGLVQNSRQG